MSPRLTVPPQSGQRVLPALNPDGTFTLGGYRVDQVRVLGPRDKVGHRFDAPSFPGFPAYGTEAFEYAVEHAYKRAMLCLAPGELPVDPQNLRYALYRGNDSADGVAFMTKGVAILGAWMAGHDLLPRRGGGAVMTFCAECWIEEASQAWCRACEHPDVIIDGMMPSVMGRRVNQGWAKKIARPDR
jgi:hypothetical protein